MGIRFYYIRGYIISITFMANLFNQTSSIIDNQELFFKLYNAKDEEDLLNIIDLNPTIFDDSNWKPLGGNFSNYGVVKKSTIESHSSFNRKSHQCH